MYYDDNAFLNVFCRCYYIQDDSDPGTVMETSVPSKDVRNI